jgi:hypothetical protein
VTKSPGDDDSIRRRDGDGPWHAGTPRETLLERQIREAMADGRFDNLPHHGAPLPNDENPHAGDWGLAFHILKNAGFAPPWIEADKAVRALLARRDAILDRAGRGPEPPEFTRRRDHRALEQLVAEINESIARVNAEAPSARQHRQPLILADELARYDESCPREHDA